MQHKTTYLLFCKFTLHVSGVKHTHHQEYKNCNYSFWYWCSTNKTLLKNNLKFVKYCKNGISKFHFNFDYISLHNITISRQVWANITV